jgi:hypothetical protein
MNIRAVLRKGVIQPIEPLPPDWHDGQELLVESNGEADQEQVQQWAHELEAAAAAIPAEEHDRFLRALDEIERESKDAVRKGWEKP